MRWHDRFEQSKEVHWDLDQADEMTSIWHQKSLFPLCDCFWIDLIRIHSLDVSFQIVQEWVLVKLVFPAQVVEDCRTDPLARGYIHWWQEQQNLKRPGKGWLEYRRKCLPTVSVVRVEDRVLIILTTRKGKQLHLEQRRSGREGLYRGSNGVEGEVVCSFVLLGKLLLL